RVPAEKLDQLVAGARTVAQGGAELRLRSPDVERGRLGSDPRQPRAVRLADRLRPEPVVAPRDDVDRAAEKRSLDDGSALERTRQLPELEPLEPRPEGDVRGGRVLRLDPSHLLDRSLQRQPRPPEQQLPCQQSAVEIPGFQDALA